MSEDYQDERVGRRYRIIRPLGSGGLGNVYLCEDTVTQEKVAVKRLKENINLPEDVYEHTKKEAALLSELRHRNVIKVYDLGMDPQGMYFVFEYINGPTLAHVIKEGPMPLLAFFHMAFQVLEGLGAAHRKGVLHLDIKPANIMLHQYPEPTFTAKILDFGLAKLAIEMSEHRQNEATIGSVYYISPEQLRHQPLSPATDLYSLGHVFYHAICSRVPFHEPDPVVVRNAHLSREPDWLHEVYPQCPYELSEWIHCLMAKDPAQRPPTTQAALTTLTQISMLCSRQGLLHPPGWEPQAPLMERVSETSRQAASRITEQVSEKSKRITTGISGFWNRIRGQGDS
jgi:serine/threonine protein kinase